MKITYHQTGISPKCGDDHTLANNWNPNRNYGTEYTEVHFFIDSVGYRYPEYFFSPEDRLLFDQEVAEIFSYLGWNAANGGGIRSTATVRNGKSHLYLHPQDFSGILRKNDVGAMANALSGRERFSLRWVQLNDTVYEDTDEEYTSYLAGREKEIRDMIFRSARTTRYNKLVPKEYVAMLVAEKVGRKRISDNPPRKGNAETGKYVLQILQKMVEEGLLLSLEQGEKTYVRSLNRKEQDAYYRR